MPPQNRDVGLEHQASDGRPAFSVVAERAGSIWFISVPDVPEAIASTRRRDRIEGIARGLIAQELGVSPAEVELVIISPED